MHKILVFLYPFLLRTVQMSFYFSFTNFPHSQRHKWGTFLIVGRFYLLYSYVDISPSSCITSHRVTTLSDLCLSVNVWQLRFCLISGNIIIFRQWLPLLQLQPMLFTYGIVLHWKSFFKYACLISLKTSSRAIVKLFSKQLALSCC